MLFSGKNKNNQTVELSFFTKSMFFIKTVLHNHLFCRHMFFSSQGIPPI